MPPAKESSASSSTDDKKTEIHQRLTVVETLVNVLKTTTASQGNSIDQIAQWTVSIRYIEAKGDETARELTALRIKHEKDLNDACVRIREDLNKMGARLEDKIQKSDEDKVQKIHKLDNVAYLVKALGIFLSGGAAVWLLERLLK